MNANASQHSFGYTSDCMKKRQSGSIQSLKPFTFQHSSETRPFQDLFQSHLPCGTYNLVGYVTIAICISGYYHYPEETSFTELDIVFLTR